MSFEITSRISERRPPRSPFLFLDGGRGDGPSFIASEPREILTERDGSFVCLRGPHSTPVADPVEWIVQRSDAIVAGFLSYEFAWCLLDVRAPRPRTRTPLCWVATFDELNEPATWEWPVDGELSPPACRVTPERYADDVQRCVDSIWDGELFEINYTARFDAHWSGSPPSFYERLRRHGRGDWFALLHTEQFSIASVSPEMFLHIDDRQVTSRPIKGTRPRSEDAGADRALAEELLASEKDRSENVMIVDLMRNDLTTVCEPGSVEAPHLCELESYPQVHHLVSTVTGTLRRDVSPIEAMLACFPAGSITGAPKLRAIELAAEVEEGARGAYTGSIFVSTGSTLRSSVLIRTATLLPDADGFSVEYGAGGAVVAHSDPRSEWAEALTKLAPLERVRER